MKKIYYIILSLLTLTIVSCEEDANEWEVDPSYDRLFSATTFKSQTLLPTAISIEYTGVTSAKTYHFEFSEGDSLEFNHIVRSVDILADTLTTTSSATAVTARTYSTWFEDLLGLTRYSVRMKAIAEDGKESDYVKFVFDTPAEQIFTKIVAGLHKTTVYWDAEKEATHLVCYAPRIYTDEAGNVTQLDTLWLPQIELTAEQKQTGKAIITGLESGTSYGVEIYNGTNKRGTITCKTLGKAEAPGTVTIELTTDDDASTKLAEAVAAGATDAMLVFKGGEIYEAGDIKVPNGIVTLSLLGDVDAEGALPEIHANKISFDAPITTLTMQYIDLDNELKTAYFMDINSGNCFSRFVADNCILRNIQRSFIYIRNAAATVEYINFNYCTIQNMSSGGYGFLNFNKGTIGELNFNQCTIMDIGDQLVDIRISLQKITMDRCVFCNYNIGVGKIWRIDKDPADMSVTNTIFTGDNKGTKVNAGNKDYGFVDYLGCYLTSDFVENSNKFKNATILEMTSEDLFVDPRNGDFHIKPEVKFSGDGIAGPSKWWTEK